MMDFAGRDRAAAFLTSQLAGRAGALQYLDGYGLRCVGGFESGLSAFGADEAIAKNHAHVAENARLVADLGGAVLVVGTDGPSGPIDDPVEQPTARPATRTAPTMTSSRTRANCCTIPITPLIHLYSGFAIATTDQRKQSY